MEIERDFDFFKKKSHRGIVYLKKVRNFVKQSRHEAPRLLKVKHIILIIFNYTRHENNRNRNPRG
jgi:hypothetical protein